jgi:NAD(P)-dependent dehydrogenase (short-subunit alcohol dehydrogenase family)
LRLKGKVAVITGSSTGNGASIARAFAKEGADVVVHYRSSEVEAEKVVTAIKRMGREAISIKADISIPEESRALFKQVKRKFGRVDVLVSRWAPTEDAQRNSGPKRCQAPEPRRSPGLPPA